MYIHSAYAVLEVLLAIVRSRWTTVLDAMSVYNQDLHSHGY